MMALKGQGTEDLATVAGKEKCIYFSQPPPLLAGWVDALHG